YAEDALPQGNDYERIYSVQYWNYVDIFIYFSHNLITIPPPSWTNAAHRNGVRCLGTIITEWTKGLLEVDELVSGPGLPLSIDRTDDVDRHWFSKVYADKLVDIAVYYGFDGWFINVESHLRGGDQQVNQTLAFLAYFQAQIHERIPGGQLIWYDSVITTGRIHYQNQLSLENYRFFQQSDGIFTNYGWKSHQVKLSAELAGSRKRDVYTGIDIWGRGTYGGGGFTTFKALKIIQRDQTSVALFAPGWTYEHLGKDSFMTNDRLFWIGHPGAGIHAESQLPVDNSDVERIVSLFYDDFRPISDYILARPSGCANWFYSSFDRGFGLGYWVDGKVLVSNTQWSTVTLTFKPSSPDVHVGLNISLQRIPELAQCSPERAQAREAIWCNMKRRVYEFLTELIGPEPSTEGESKITEQHIISDAATPAKTVKQQTQVPLRQAFQENQGMFAGSASDVMNVLLLPQHHECMYRTEALEDGWQKLTLDVNNLFILPDLSGEEVEVGSHSSAFPEIHLAGIGVTLRYEETAFTEEADSDILPLPPQYSLPKRGSGRPLITLGSLAVVPTRTINYRASLIQGLLTSDLEFVIKEPCVSDLQSQGTRVTFTQQQWKDKQMQWRLKPDCFGKDNMPITIKVSATFTWSIGYPITLSTPNHVVSNQGDNVKISNADYSHFCVYISFGMTEKHLSGAQDQDIGNADKRTHANSLHFVGTSFTDRYRMINFETPLLPSILGQNEELTIWAWVQGIRRDGRAELQNNWAKVQLI
ncbi:hypothetical protein BGW38_002237, partial [Lunasporangiospora selenospora]